MLAETLGRRRAVLDPLCALDPWLASVVACIPCVLWCNVMGIFGKQSALQYSECFCRRLCWSGLVISSFVRRLVGLAGELAGKLVLKQTGGALLSLGAKQMAGKGKESMSL